MEENKNIRLGAEWGDFGALQFTVGRMCVELSRYVSGFGSVNQSLLEEIVYISEVRDSVMQKICTEIYNFLSTPFETLNEPNFNSEIERIRREKSDIAQAAYDSPPDKSELH